MRSVFHQLRNVCAGIVLFMETGTNITAQSIELLPTLVSNCGGSIEKGGVALSYSIGEAIINTTGGSDAGLILTQGFQQPIDTRAFEGTETTRTLFFYTGITPDGDEINDTWIIDNISNYPENTVSIFNRWGNKVWNGNGYNNTTVVWDGTNNNKNPLPIGTYFYVVTKDGTKEPAKGWVELTKK